MGSHFHTPPRKSSGKAPAGGPSPAELDRRILLIRGQRVLLDSDLALLYGVPTFRFNEAVKRNSARFPPDFRFQLTRPEFASLRSQIASSVIEVTDNKHDKTNSSQIAMSSGRHRGATYLPWVFSEHGALMAAQVLHAPRAVEMSIFVVRAFVRLREVLATHREFAAKLAELEQKLEGHDTAIAEIVATLRTMLAAPGSDHGRKIGFRPGNR
jgi:hypothetical protein